VVMPVELGGERVQERSLEQHLRRVHEASATSAGDIAR
jgi:hypothetical protein